LFVIKCGSCDTEDQLERGDVQIPSSVQFNRDISVESDPLDIMCFEPGDSINVIIKCNRCGNEIKLY
jgi:hypothetical protein